MDVVAIPVIIAYAMFTWWLMKQVPLPYVAPEWRLAEKTMVITRMKAHGIYGYIRTPKRTLLCWDGRLCKL
jgi:hypothetical protein